MTDETNRSITQSLLEDIVSGIPSPAFVSDHKFNFICVNKRCVDAFNDCFGAVNQNPVKKYLINSHSRVAAETEFTFTLPSNCNKRAVSISINKKVIQGETFFLGAIVNMSELVISSMHVNDTVNAFRSLPEMLHSINDKGKLIFVSDKWLQVLGYTEGEVLGRPSADFLTAESKEKAARILPEFFRTGVCEDVSYQMVCKNGDAIDVLLSASLTKDMSENGPFSVAIIKNVTDSVRAKILLKERSKRLEHVIEGTSAGTWEWNIQTGETRFNERWAEIVGYQLHELEPTTIDTWMSLAHPDDLSESGKLLEEHFSGQTSSYEYQARMKHKNGHWVWVIDRGKVLTWTDAGEPEWMFGTHMDITWQVEQKLALKKSEAFLRRAGEVAELGSWEYNVKDNILIWSEQTRILHEVEPEYQPEATKAIEFYAPEARPVIKGLVEKAVEEHKGWDIELPFITAKGRAIWVHSVGEPELDNGEVVSIVGTFRDVTASVRIKQELKEKREEAEQALAERSKLFAKVSHELRTPLNGITGMLGASIDERDEQRRKDKLRLAMRSADVLLSVINESLDYSKISHGELHLEPSDFDLKLVLDDVAALYQESCVKKHLCFQSNLNVEPDLWVHFDATRLSQIISNLLNNAVKFTHQGKVELVANAKKSGNQVSLQIKVVDTGIGMDTHMQQKLFTPFSQAAPGTSSKYGGTGLGLSIVKELICAMQGDISVNSEEGVGTSFCVKLTIPVSQKPEQCKSEQAQSIDFSGIAVLVVDDNEINRLVMESLLESLNLKSDFAIDGQDAIEKCKLKDYDIVFMDCIMPEIDGLQATREIRSSISGYSDIPIVALTANTSEDDQRACKEAGMNDYLSKPVQLASVRKVFTSFFQAME